MNKIIDIIFLNPDKKNVLILIGSCIATILIIYWLKCQIDVNIFHSISFSKILPFKYFQRKNIIDERSQVILFDDSFESKPIFTRWSKLWVNEKGKVTHDYDLTGRNNSCSLLISSKSKKSWVYSHKKYVKVQSGDKFKIIAAAKIEDEKVHAYVGVSAFDENLEVIDWNYIKEEFKEYGQWNKLVKKFTVSDSIKYLRFRLSGLGVGEIRFDDILFQREN